MMDLSGRAFTQFAMPWHSAMRDQVTFVSPKALTCCGRDAESIGVAIADFKSLAKVEGN